ncbi:MAG TPA: DUF3631 domain-containing protein [Planctomycetota bacterium]|nr:DUF3631 domain-containing protein [Planctomycetota bacterium]
MSCDRGRRLLDVVRAIICRHVVLDAAQADAVAAWVVHTFAATRRVVEVSPRLLLTAPPASGKTTLLRVVAALADEGRPMIAPTAASIWRRLEVGPATILIDEGHHVLEDPHPDLLAVMDAGWEADGTVPRCVRRDDAWITVDYQVFAPVAIAMIGRPREAALLSRCIEVQLVRHRRPRGMARATRDILARYASIREHIGRWVESVADAIRAARPRIPRELSDRSADLWTPLLAIAEVAGGPWPARLRRAAVRLSSEAERTAAAAEVDVGVRLLRELQAACPVGVDVWPTRDIVWAVSAIDDAPWADWRGGMTPHRLARILAAYGVAPVHARVCTTTVRGYAVRDLRRAWEAYAARPRRPHTSPTTDCPSAPPADATAATPPPPASSATPEEASS